MTVLRFGAVEAVATTGEPAVRHLHRLPRIRKIAGVRRTFVERHHDIGADCSLNVHNVLGRECVYATVNV
ncbi:hypothetical protein D3C87_2010630 [compost metagenome]